jgi:hypothetical protein
VLQQCNVLATLDFFSRIFFEKMSMQVVTRHLLKYSIKLDDKRDRCRVLTFYSILENMS